MRPARYSVIRYVADPARNEPANIGILVWDQSGVQLRVDSDAVDRIIRDNPHLERDALLYLEHYLRDNLLGDWSEAGDSIEDLLVEWSHFPLHLSESRHTSTDENVARPLDNALDHLVARIVHPRHRGAGGRQSAVAQLASRMKPLIGIHAVARNHPFTSSRSGTPRSVHFFANSGANVALDAVSLAVKDAETIRLRADAEAYKVVDILEENEIRFLVYCEFHRDPELHQVNERARRILESAGAEVMIDIDDVVDQINSRIALL